MVFRGVSFDIKEFTIDDPVRVHELIDSIISECVDYSMPKENQINLKLGITEAVSNAIRHGSKDLEQKSIKIGYKIVYIEPRD